MAKMLAKTKTFDSKHFTTSQLAALYGVGPSAVSNWHKRGGCPRNSDGSYDLTAVIAWREDRIRAEVDDAMASSGKDSPNLERLRAARADMAELEFKTRLGKVIDLEQVKQREVTISTIFKQSLLNAPRELAPRLVGREIVEIETMIREKHESILRALAK